MKQIITILRHVRKNTIKLLAKIIAFVCLTSSIIGCNDNNGEEKMQLDLELDQLRTAVSSFSSLDNAISHGYGNEFTGYRSQMGYHYLNSALLDDHFELKKPEVLMYAPDDLGNMKFVGVEYAVPIEDLLNPPPAPEGFTGNNDVWEINHEFSVWTLHVWVGLDNPHGIFASHNPLLP